VQLHGEPLRDFTDALRNVGATVVPVPVYRWMAPLDLEPLDRLLDALAAGTVDAVTFTSALAATGLLRRARECGCERDLVTALRERAAAVCVGPVTAGPLLERGIPATWPSRYRVGALIRHVTEVLSTSAPVLSVAGHRLEVRGSVVLVDGELRPVPPGPMAVLRALARNPGWVVPRSDLLAELPGGAPTSTPSRPRSPACAPASAPRTWSRRSSSAATVSPPSASRGSPRSALRLFQAEADLHRHLDRRGGAGGVQAAADRRHLEPVEVTQRLAGPLERTADGVVDALVRAADDLGDAVNGVVVGHGSLRASRCAYSPRVSPDAFSRRHNLIPRSAHPNASEASATAIGPAEHGWTG
jgi:hypothetical protein